MYLPKSKGTFVESKFALALMGSHTPPQEHYHASIAVEESRNLSTLLDLFVGFTGLKINCTKSAFIGFGLAQEVELQCSEALGTLSGSLPMRYLGLPLR